MKLRELRVNDAFYIVGLPGTYLLLRLGLGSALIKHLGSAGRTSFETRDGSRVEFDKSHAPKTYLSKPSSRLWSSDES